MMPTRFLTALAGAVLLLFSTAFPAQAGPVIVPSPPQLAAESYLLLDAQSGRVLVEHNADTPLAPASLTKMMSGYIVANEMATGRLAPDDEIRISIKAWKMGGSKMFVREGTRVPALDLVRGMVIQSGNDATIALAEHIAGSEEAFVDMMNEYAALLGMTQTHFKNATGWPEEGHVTTARDMAILGKALVTDFPEHYQYHAEKYFEYNGINQANRNQLLWQDNRVDGIKTGHTEEAGYCLVASAVEDDMRLIAVVMNTTSEQARAQETQKLLTYGFRFFETHRVYSAGDVLNTAEVWFGRADQVPLGVSEDIYLTVPRGAEDDLKAAMHIDEVIEAPINAQQPLGELTIDLDGERLVTEPLVAMEAVEEAGLFSRLWDAIKLFFWQLFR